MVLSRLDPTRPVVVEAESAKVGDLRLPSHLWAAMVRAPRIIIEAPLAERAAYLTRAYADIVADGDRLAQVIGFLRQSHSHEVIDTWTALAATGQFEYLAQDLMARHYDPRYEKHRARMPVACATVSAPCLEESALDGLAVQVAAQVDRVIGRDGGLAAL
jgi:tRNA 2-selenouridine synthase